ncbi:hypothetical protein J2S40_000465 [Nocardioides luteus]|uniref:Cell wall-active antibiotics response LiaF-like C-terminal domain-containing protein n=1 Tax=Nocardioides luteus TaxID=1844 RepID=A0ABQ5SWE2_9ACTN|nr:DUF1707 domain-containing protein [Nocardioides luteus]MDR7309407.1 hypothetical protein [Nocardioides luteus]GGR51077.1 hypothetical protein GCM10010197_16300 [Nocardioides luteus]GLJ67814.1 hypothetical protein GCM10017579_18500 [Nocardioides luteus]
MGLPEPHPGQPRRPDLRVSDADRHAVADILREAAGEGRLDIEELEERIEETYKAKTYADLEPITRDLPVAGRAPSTPPASADAAPNAPVVYGEGAANDSASAFLSSVERKGVWTMPQHLTVNAVLGDANIDLREAHYSAREVVINATSILGSVKVTVPPNVRVVVEGNGVLGEFKEPSDKVPEALTADSPVVRVRGMAVLGDVTVKRRGPKGPRRSLRQHLGLE